MRTEHQTATVASDGCLLGRETDTAPLPVRGPPTLTATACTVNVYVTDDPQRRIRKLRMSSKDRVDTRQVSDELLAHEEAHLRAADLLAQVPTGSAGILQCRNSGAGADKRHIRQVEDAGAANGLPLGDRALEEVVLPRPHAHARRHLQ